MKLNAIDRLRYAAWAWLAAAFLVGLSTGGVAAGLPLLQQLREAKQALERLQQRDELGSWGRVAPIPGEEALSDLAGARDVAPAPPPNLPAPQVQQAVAAANQALQQVETPTRSVAPGKVPTQSSSAPGRAAAPAPVAKPKAAPQPLAPVVAKTDPASQQAEVEAQKVAAARAQEALRAKALGAVQATGTEAVAQAVTTAQLKPAAPAGQGNNAPTQRVTKDEAGLSEVESGGVTFKSGRRVAVGDSFPSGERLVSVDPAIGEIITTKRRIVLKASVATSP